MITLKSSHVSELYLFSELYIFVIHNVSAGADGQTPAAHVAVVKNFLQGVNYKDDKVHSLHIFLRWNVHEKVKFLKDHDVDIIIF